MSPLLVTEVSRLPATGDNVAIATRRLEAGTQLQFADGATHELRHTVLEGHRFAVAAIAAGQALLSWGLPFGEAIAPIGRGDYVCNASMLAALGVRTLDSAVRLPAAPNFADRQTPFVLNESQFRPGVPVERATEPRTFLGYRRPGARGVGTRNYLVVVGTTSRTAGVARQLVARLQPLAQATPGIDGIVAIAHTEGGGVEEPNNASEVLRALAGFLVHPNVGAVLAIDYGTEPITNRRLETFMRERGYPLDDVPHAFLTLSRGVAAGLREGKDIVRGWASPVSAMSRTPQPMSALKIALQCGGSDAFSGVSGNPLAGAMVHEVIRHGGTGVLTETDEAIGAEAYLLANVRDLATARALLAKIEAFRERLRWHGVTAESNPSAGNKFRGLYNIALKSIGAVQKKDPRTRIEQVCEYADPLREPGFCFMNGPGNDLEGVAGQIAAGCNLVLFVTGNGSITNFPFVPTLKITTTTRRHQLLRHEMDINAGRYLDGEPMDAVLTDALNTLVATASGDRTKGERAGHSQVSLWRNWRQTDAGQVAELKARPSPAGQAAATAENVAQQLHRLNDRERAAVHDIAKVRVRTIGGRLPATERVGLVLPTSLCSAQIARMAAERLNATGAPAEAGVSRFVALPHTEGCGFGGESMYHLLHRTYRGYLTHPNVASAVLLEHGCEKVPNDAMRRQLESAGLAPSRFGWVSVQLDGGIANALAKVGQWFSANAPAAASATTTAAPVEELPVVGLSLAFVTDPATPARALDGIALLLIAVVAGGGTALVAESDPLLANPLVADVLLGGRAAPASLAYGDKSSEPGLHLVDTETDHWVENATGLVAAGAHAIVGIVTTQPAPGHPLVPVVQFTEASSGTRFPPEEVDGVLSGDAIADMAKVVQTLAEVLDGRRRAAAEQNGIVDFQLTRGLLGITT
jgi:altronate dehydratase